MRYFSEFAALFLIGLCLVCHSDTRADEPQASEGEAQPYQPPTNDAVAEEPVAPRFVLLLTRRGVSSQDPIVRTSPATPIPDYDGLLTEAFPEPAFSPQQPIPKRSSRRPTPRPTTPETLRIMCADVKMSGTAAAGKSVNYTIECTGPLVLDNGTTTIRCSKLSFADGALTLDDVTIHQSNSTAGLLEEMRAKQLTIKFPLESVTIQDADKYRAPEIQQDKPHVNYNSFEAS